MWIFITQWGVFLGDCQWNLQTHLSDFYVLIKFSTRNTRSVLYLTMVQHKNSECTQLTGHTNKWAVILIDWLIGYCQGGCVAADCVYVNVIHFKLSTNWLNSYSYKILFLWPEPLCRWHRTNKNKGIDCIEEVRLYIQNNIGMWMDVKAFNWLLNKIMSKYSLILLCCSYHIIPSPYLFEVKGRFCRYWMRSTV